MHSTEKLGGKYKNLVKVDNPFPVDYDPSTDLSDPLDAPSAHHSISTSLGLGDGWWNLDG
jgi:hypothetical protein